MAGLEIPPNRPQPAPDTAREKEGSRHQHLLEIERPQLLWITHPVILNHRSSRIRDQALQCQDEHEHIVHFPEEWDVVGDEIHRQQDIRDRSGDEQLVRVRDPLIRQQPAEQSQKVRQLL